jgi:hypothetical protein
MSFYCNIVLSFYLNIVCKNIVCELGLKFAKYNSIPFSLFLCAQSFSSPFFDDKKELDVPIFDDTASDVTYYSQKSVIKPHKAIQKICSTFFASFDTPMCHLMTLARTLPPPTWRDIYHTEKI